MAVKGIRFSVDGDKELRKALKSRDPVARRGLATGLFALGNNIMTDSKRLVPVDFGVLRGSGFVTQPRNVDKGEMDVTVGYGGPASAYAEAQHDRLDYHHEEGEAKYLERPFNAHRSSGMRFVAAFVQQALAGRQQEPATFKAHPSNPNSGPKTGKSRSRKGKGSPGARSGKGSVR